MAFPIPMILIPKIRCEEDLVLQQRRTDAREGRARAARRNVTIPLIARDARSKEDDAMIRPLAVLLPLLLRSIDRGMPHTQALRRAQINFEVRVAGFRPGGWVGSPDCQNVKTLALASCRLSKLVNLHVQTCSM